MPQKFSFTMKKYDVILLTESKYIAPNEIDDYTQNVLTEDALVKNALEKVGCKVKKIAWDNNSFDWSSTHFALFRTTWDYFHRFDEFKSWLDHVNKKTKLINSYDQILWNIDKHYLQEIHRKGVNIPPSYFIKKNSKESLENIMLKMGWTKTVLKPTISGAARHTYKIDMENLSDHEIIFKELIQKEDFLLQEFQKQVITKGEVAFMLYGGEYSHAILKKAKPGDFRVQDDFGGTVHQYSPSQSEIQFAKNTVNSIAPIPTYARVDMIWDNNNQPAVSEIELIEPELWFRFNNASADLLAEKIVQKLKLEKLS